MVRERPRAGARHTVWIAAGVLLALAVAFGAWAYVRTRPSAASVTRRTIVAVVPLSGQVVAPPGERADVMAVYQAPVARVYTSLGARVSRGEVLVELALANAQAAYEQARVQVRAAETASVNAEREYGTGIRAARQRLDATRAAERRARQPLSVTVTPAPAEGEPGVVPAPAAAPDLATANAERMAAESELAAATSSREAAVLPFRQQLEAARAAFQDARSGRKQAMVRAPISGTVLALNAQPGVVVGTDRKTPIVTIVDLDALQVQGEVTPEQAGVLKAKMPATVTLTGVAGVELHGKVASVTTAAGEGLLKKTRYVVLVSFENPKGAAKPGMKAGAAIRPGEAKDVLAVPSEAVKTDASGRPVVRALRSGQWQSVIVETGLSDGRYTEIRSGLQENETVQVRPDLM